VTVQFEATAYVAVRDSVLTTPSVFSVTSPVYVPVAESNVAWLGPMTGDATVCAAVHKPVGAHLKRRLNESPPRQQNWTQRWQEQSLKR
jgi:hypothetical protein